MEHASDTRSLPASPLSTGPDRRGGRPARADRHSDPPAPLLLGGAPPPAAPGAPGPALCRAGAASEGDEPVRVDLVWRDPVTGLDLRLDLEGSPALVERLIAEGFRAPPGGDDDDLEAA